MAMLAEPRRKQKVINLRAKNNAWSNDSTKFGQRMLEKMGWSSGKGLGAHEDGMTEHVVARYKNDEKGLGFEDKNDQWTKHEDDFNALLANLSNASDNNENLHSGISLEDKSKKSKARIHYHKFTRGKDISRYSEKDLANIFGKKSFKNTKVVKETLKEDLKTTEQVFTEKGSMEDYFKNKLAAFKSKTKVVSNVKEGDGDEPNYTFCGFAQNTEDTKVSCTAISYCTEKNINTIENSILESSINGTEKAKKKNKKSKDKDLETLLNVNLCSNNADVAKECHTHEKIKKKKNLNNKINSDNMTEMKNDNKLSTLDSPSDVDQIISSKKHKKRKNDASDMLENSCIQNSTINDSSDQDLILPSKKKKKSKKKEQNENDLVTNIILEETTEVLKRKKKKKNKD